MPLAFNALTKLAPIKPAAPVTTIIFAASLVWDEAVRAISTGFIEISQVFDFIDIF